MQLGNQSQVPAKLLIRELFRWSWSKSERNPIVLGVDTIPVSGRSAFPWGKPTRASSPSSLPSKQQMTHHNERARRGGPKVYLCTSDQLAETGGERPHKMKSPQTPFLTTDRKSTRLNSSHLGISYA